MGNSIISNYTPPLDQLLTYGEANAAKPENWPNYVELGFGSAHIADLIRMAIDEQLHHTGEEYDESWAPIHAWRALGQLHAEAAIEPLLTLFHTQEDSEWVTEELPEVFGMIGPAALPALTAYIEDQSCEQWPRIHAIGCIEKIGTFTPAAHSTCIEILSKQLEHFAEENSEFNAFLILALAAKLKAVEVAPLMERAFAAQAVDESLMGGWDEVQVCLGLKSWEEVPEKDFLPFLNLPPSLAPVNAVTTSPVASGKRHGGGISPKKARNKIAKQSRKKNRKR